MCNCTKTENKLKYLNIYYNKKYIQVIKKKVQ